MRSNEQLAAGREICPPFFLGRLIIRPLRFLYLFGWLGSVFCGPVEDALVPICCYRTFSPAATGHFLHTDLCRTNFIFCNINNVLNCILHFACIPAAFIIQDLLPQGLVLPALSSMKHMQSPAGSWLCRKAFGVQIPSPITQNYQAVLQLLWALVWQRTAHLSSAGNAGSALNPPARMFGFTGVDYPWG